MFYDTKFNGYLRVQNTVEKSNYSNTYGINLSISKFINPIKSKISLAGNYFIYSSTVLQQNQFVDYKIHSINIRPGIETQIFDWASVSYYFLLRSQKNIVQKVKNPYINSISNHLSLNVFPIDKLGFTAGFEHYYSNVNENNKNIYFVDLDVEYSFKVVDVTLSWYNILNTKNYVNASYDGINEYGNVYQIRPSQILLSVKFKIL
ncbi:MAG: hypothetical protein ACOX4D_02960 [Bacteroidales bacterium]|jgi:hypothetical protein